MNQIPESYIEDLLTRLNIVDVIDSRVKLKKAGRDYAACCPFHDEKTPSFTVIENKQFYHCFGCGAGGDAIKFVQECDGVGFRDAVASLAQSVGLQPLGELPTLSPERQAQENAAREARRVKLRAQQDLEIREMQDAVAAVVEQVLYHCGPTGSSEYLGRKKVGAYGVAFPRAPFMVVVHPAERRCELELNPETFGDWFKKAKAGEVSVRMVRRGDFVVPVYNVQMQVRNMQVISGKSEAGKAKKKNKMFLKGGQKQGCFFILRGQEGHGPVLLAEGYATAASLHMATKFTVVVCWDAGNMVLLSEKILPELFPGRDFLVCGDFDHSKDDNPGADKAAEASLNLACGAVVPRFPGFDGETARTDFNDLHWEFGLRAVESQITAAIECGNTLPEELLPPVPPFPPPEDVPPPANDSPAPPSEIARPSLDESLGRYAMTDDGRIWDDHGRKFLKEKAVRDFVGGDTYKEWLNHVKRRNVIAGDVIPLAKASAQKGVQGLVGALARYVYLNPSQNVWDMRERKLVAVNDLKIAIASCYVDWVKHPQRLEIPAENLVFDPQRLTPTEDYINRFRGLALEPITNDDACKHIVRMLQRLCNNDQAAWHWLFQWLAYPLKNIGAKMKTAVLMHSSVHGSGKSWFFDGVMGAIYGEYGRVFGQTQLESQYNDWMSECLFGVFEEVLSRSQKYSHTGTIKQMITGERYRVEKKFMSGWEESNHMNTVFLSNEVQPLPVEPSDRRFLIVWPKEKLIDELKTGVLEDLQRGGAAAFYGWLLRYPIDSSFSPATEPPMTEAKERIIDFGRPSWEIFFIEWERGDLDECPFVSVRVRDLFKAYERWCGDRREHCMGQNKFSGFIASKVRKRPDVHYSDGMLKGKGVFFIVGEPEENENSQEYFGRCVREWELAQGKYDDEYKEAS